jgi:hypothetical protein
LVSGVPSARSMGGGGGLPDLPRDGRGRGVVSETRDLVVSETRDLVVSETRDFVVSETRDFVVSEARDLVVSAAGRPDFGVRGIDGIWRAGGIAATR